jgi:hypothetical protein
MSYIDQLTEQVKTIFDQASDRNDLHQKVMDLVIAKSKESFKNGLEAARKRQNKAKHQKASQS